jgi:AcrR family transcriptional regulator
MPSHPSSRKPGRPRSADIERRILGAAQACFACHGFDGVAMEDVARHAATSKATVYLHFRTKQDLFKAALDNLLAQLAPASELTSGIVGDGLEERLLVLATRVGRLFSGARFELIRRAIDADLPLPLREHIRTTVGIPYFQAIHDALREEAARGCLEFGDTKSATSFFIALIVGPEALRSRWCGASFGPIDDAHLRDAVQVFLQGRTARPFPS